MENGPSVYVGTYEKYNNGSIAGAWVALAKFDTADDFYKHIADLHKDETDPEYMYQDFENFPREMYSESGMDIDKLIEYAHLDDEQRTLIDEYMDATGSTYDEARERAEESYQMRLETYNHEREYGEYIVDDAGIFEVPEALQGYIDYEAVGRDYLMDMSVSENGYVFTNY